MISALVCESSCPVGSSAQNFRFVDERAGDRYALLLPSGKLSGQAVLSPGQTNQSQHALGFFVGIPGITVFVEQGELHVLDGAHAGKEIEGPAFRPRGRHS